MLKVINKSHLLELSDERLAVLANKNNQEALEVLVSRYLKVIYNFTYRAVANREEAEDLTQKVFIKVWKNLSKFDASKTFKPWLYKIAKNTYLDYYKKQQPSPWSALTQDTLDKIQPLHQAWSVANDSPQEIVDKHLLEARLDSALANLEPSVADIIKLHHEADLSFKTIAEITNEPLNTVKSSYRRALGKIKKFVD